MNSRQKKVPEEIAVKHAKNGGFIVRHSFNNMGSGMSYQPPEEHAFTSHAEMLAHVEKHTKRSPYSEAEPDADDAPLRRASGRAPTGVGRLSKVAPPTRRTFGAGVD